MMAYTPNAIGWDVGGWNCDKNASSRDALVVLDAEGRLLGTPWRGNLKPLLNGADTAADFVGGLLDRCKVAGTNCPGPVVVAIDAPLAFPEALRSLLDGQPLAASLGHSATNPYLYRFTERRLAEPTTTPLSVVKDMIGSQSTKAIHALRRYTPVQDALGVWSDGSKLRMIETYPAACRRRLGRELVIEGVGGHDDIRDAGICAWVAAMFCNAPDKLEGPTPEAPESEGWIWLPKATVTYAS